MQSNIQEGFSTKAIHAGQDPAQWSHWSLVPPLVMSTTFQQNGPAEHNVNQRNEIKFDERVYILDELQIIYVGMFLRVTSTAEAVTRRAMY